MLKNLLKYEFRATARTYGGIYLALLATDGMLVKRPFVVDGDLVLTGFREAEWKEKLI